MGNGALPILRMPVWLETLKSVSPMCSSWPWSNRGMA